jgi:gamma-glutamyl-gamma-aminobutyrate hydrolase PuuD
MEKVGYLQMSNKGKTFLVLEPTYGFDHVARERGFKTILGRDIESRPELEEQVDVVVFMGGTDISPTIYGQKPTIFSNHHNHERDKREISFYNKFKHLPKLGICRGAQLINCLNGGKLFQHVYNHGSGDHAVVDTDDKEHVVCSVHHQMMILPDSGATLVAWREGSKLDRRFNGTEMVASDGIDPEVVFFEKDKSLCFQAHPEFGPETDYFFNLVERYIL